MIVESGVNLSKSQWVRVNFSLVTKTFITKDWKRISKRSPHICTGGKLSELTMIVKFIS